jgi:hypothetical protein
MEKNQLSGIGTNILLEIIRKFDDVEDIKSV